MVGANGKKEITIREVALKAGVSQATVGRVIGGYGSVSEKTKLKVQKAIKAMHYVPNAIAQSMKSKNTNTVGVVVGNITNPFFSELVHAIEDVTAQAGFSLIISNTGEDIHEEIRALKMLHSKRIDGILVATTQNINVILDESIKPLYTGSVPTVYIDREIFSLGELCVKTDHFGGAYEATNYLIGKGHRKIGLIAGLPSISTMHQRVEGYKKALEDHGIAFNPDYIVFGKLASIEEGERFTKEILMKHSELTALMPLNDLLCMGTLIALHDMQIKLPDDISVIGWDDFPLAKVFDPPISMMTQDTDKIGAIAAKKLLKKIHADACDENDLGEKRITLNTKFVERKSCKDLNPQI